MPKLRFALMLVVGLAWCWAGHLHVAAAELAKPAGEVILTVSGKISKFNAESRTEFDLEMLQSLPATTFETSTTWTTGKHSFGGVSLRDFLIVLGAGGSTIHSVALNDYAIDIPVSDAVEGGPILAYSMDGKPMSVRDKGPLWIVYPYDANPDYRTEHTFPKWHAV